MGSENSFMRHTDIEKLPKFNDEIILLNSGKNGGDIARQFRAWHGRLQLTNENDYRQKTSVA